MSGCIRNHCPDNPGTDVRMFPEWVSGCFQNLQCDRQYDRCLKGKKRGVTIRSFYFLAQQTGINIKTTIKRY
jgi:hypothetical protein